MCKMGSAIAHNRPKRPKTQHSAEKLMASVFWDAHGVIFIDYLEKGRPITGAYYAALLYRLVDEVRKERPHLKTKQIHPLYSPDLAPNDYYLFPNLKRWLCMRCFKSNEEVEWETQGYFEGFKKSYYLEGIEKLKDRWIRCIELKGE